MLVYSELNDPFFKKFELGENFIVVESTNKTQRERIKFFYSLSDHVPLIVSALSSKQVTTQWLDSY